MRVGIVLPSVNTVVEPWLPFALPSAFSLHLTRMLMPDKLTPESVVEMDRTDGQRALLQISSCRPVSIIYACIASSVVQGVQYDRSLVAEMRHQTGIACETAAGAMVAALRDLGISKVSVVSPYAKNIDAAEHAFLEASGISIVGTSNFGISNAFDLAKPTPKEIENAAVGISGNADGILLSCMNMRSHLVAEDLERRLNKPVVSATMAMAWALMRLAGWREEIAGFGRLGTCLGDFQP